MHVIIKTNVTTWLITGITELDSSLKNIKMSETLSDRKLLDCNTFLQSLDGHDNHGNATEL